MTAVSARVRFGARPSSAVPRYTRGETVEVWCDFRDAAGALVDASGVSVTVWWPGGTVMSPAVTPVEETAGTWRADVPTPLYPGLWRIEFACTVPADAVASAAFSVVAADASEAVAPVPSPVTSVAGRAGAVTLAPSDIAVPTTVGAGATLFNILHDLPGRPIAEYSPSLDRTGVQDMAALLNDAIQQFAANGTPLSIGTGIYRVNSPLYVQSGLKLLANDAQFLAYHNLDMVTVVNKAAAKVEATRPCGITVAGGIWGRPGDLYTDEFGTGMRSDWRGNIFALLCDNMVLDRVQIIGYPRGRGFIGGGRHVRILYPHMRHPTRLRDYPELPRTGATTSAGIRIMGGEDIWVYGVDIHSADDSVVFGPGKVGQVWGEIDTRNCGVIGGSVLADSNSGLVISMSGGAESQVIEGITFAHLRARAAGTICRVRQIGPGFVDKVLYEDIQCEESGMRDNSCAISLRGTETSPGVGGLGTVTFRTMRLKDPTSEALVLDGACRRLVVDDLEAGPPAIPTTSGVLRVLGAQEVSLSRIKVVAGLGPGAVMGGSTRTVAYTEYPDDVDGPVTISYTRPGRVENAELNGITVTGLLPGKRAVEIQNAGGGRINGLRYTPAAAAGAADGVLFARNASNFEVGQIDAREATGTPVTDLGSNNESGRVLGFGALTDSVVVVSPRRLSVDAAFARTHTPSTARAIAYDSAGDFVRVGQNAARWSAARGLLIAGPRTFAITNPLGVGGSTGTLTGTPSGSVPTSWVFSNNWVGINVERLADAPIGGLTFPVFRIYGTATSGAQLLLSPQGNTTASADQSWSARFYPVLLGGSTDGILTWNLQFLVTGGSGGLNESMLPALSDEPNPVSATALTGSGTTSVQPRNRLTFALGVPVDITFGVICFLEQGPYSTMPAVPGEGLTGSVTRGRDILTHPIPTAALTQGYVSGAMRIPRTPGGVDGGLLVLDAGSDDNRITLSVPVGTDNVRLQSIVSSAEEISETHGTMVPEETLRFALAWDLSAGALRLAIGGVETVLVATGTLPASITQLGVGRGSNTGSDTMDGEVIGLSIGAGIVTNNTLLSLVAG